MHSSVPKFHIWFLREDSAEAPFSVRFQLNEGLGALQIRPCGRTSPTSREGVIQHLSAEEIRRSFLLFQLPSRPWDECSLWPDISCSPVDLTPNEWHEFVPRGDRLCLAEDFDDDEITEILSARHEDVLSTVRRSRRRQMMRRRQPSPAAAMEAITRAAPIQPSPAAAQIPRGEHPTALIRLLRRRNEQLENESSALRREVARLRSALKGG